MHHLLGCNKDLPLLPSNLEQDLADQLNKLFISKIENIRTKLYDMNNTALASGQILPTDKPNINYS